MVLLQQKDSFGFLSGCQVGLPGRYINVWCCGGLWFMVLLQQKDSFGFLSGCQVGLPGRYINVWRYGGLLSIVLQQSDPMELFMKRRECFPASRFLSGRHIKSAVGSDVKPHSFPSSTATVMMILLELDDYSIVQHRVSRGPL